MPLSPHGTEVPPQLAITKHFRSLLHLGGLQHTMMLYTPRFLSGINIVPSFMPWGADSDGFNGFHEEPYLDMLGKITYAPNCRFLVAPDVFEAKPTDAARTLQLFDEWHPILELVWSDVNEEEHQPIALVAQNGVEDLEIPWDRMQALFIGGTTEYKFSEAVRDLVAEAHRRDMWVHMGRVNSAKRVAYCRSIDVDSFDGTGVAKYTDAMWGRVMGAVRKEGVQELMTFETETPVPQVEPLSVSPPASANREGPRGQMMIDL